MTDKKIKVPIKVRRYTFETEAGNKIFVLCWHEFGNVFVSVYRGLQELKRYTIPDERKEFSPFIVSYGDSAISKKSFINVLMKAGAREWEINCPDAIHDPITRETAFK